MTKKIEPIGKWIAVKIETERKMDSEAGLDIKANLDSRMVHGEILAFGEEANRGKLKEGDRVIIPVHMALQATLFDKKYAFMQYEHILGFEYA